MKAKKINKGWFHDRLADKQISQRKFAKMINLDPARMSETFAGKRRLQMDEAIAFATIVGVNLDDVITHAGLELPMAGKGMCSVVGTVNGAGEVTIGSVGAPRRVPLPPEAPDPTVALRIKADGDLDGWMAYYPDGIKRVPAEALNQLCVAWTGGQAILCVLKRGDVRGTHSLKAWMPGGATMENVPVDRAAPVLWVRTSS